MTTTASPPAAHAVGLIEDETPLIPELVADWAIAQIGTWLDANQPAIAQSWPGDEGVLSDQLAAKANEVYRHNEAFRTALRRKDNSGRATLQAFLLHWATADLFKAHPAAQRGYPDSLRGC